MSTSQKSKESNKNNCLSNEAFILLEYMNGHSYNIDAMNKMSEETLLNVSRLFAIASDPTRLKIMRSLINNDLCTCDCDECSNCNHLCCMVEKSVNEIVVDTGASQSLISHQLKVLKDAHLVKTRKEGQKVFYSLNDGHVKALLNIAIEHVEEK